VHQLAVLRDAAPVNSLDRSRFGAPMLKPAVEILVLLMGFSICQAPLGPVSKSVIAIG
jgi:hypothetical protein